MNNPTAKTAKKFIRGFFDATKYGYRMKIHKDSLGAITRGEWKPVGDFYQIEIGTKRDGTGFYMAEDNWVPTKKRVPLASDINAAASSDPLPPVNSDDLPF
jgi:hypothetical protein